MLSASGSQIVKNLKVWRAEDSHTGQAALGPGKYFTPDRSCAEAYGKKIQSYLISGKILGLRSNEYERIKYKVKDTYDPSENTLAEAIANQAKKEGYDGIYAGPIFGLVMFDSYSEPKRYVKATEATEATMTLPGKGMADKKRVTEDDVDPKELAMGIEVELEHTSDRALAKEIALDHLAEVPNYYSLLKQMELEQEAKIKHKEALYRILKMVRDLTILESEPDSGSTKARTYKKWADIREQFDPVKSAKLMPEKSQRYRWVNQIIETFGSWASKESVARYKRERDGWSFFANHITVGILEEADRLILRFKLDGQEKIFTVRFAEADVPKMAALLRFVLKGLYQTEDLNSRVEREIMVLVLSVPRKHRVEGKLSIPRAHLEDWYLTTRRDNQFQAPETLPLVLGGKVSGHPTFQDGSKITTTEILSASGNEVRTKNTSYVLGKPEIKFIEWLNNRTEPLDPSHPLTPLLNKLQKKDGKFIRQAKITNPKYRTVRGLIERFGILMKREGYCDFKTEGTSFLFDTPQNSSLSQPYWGRKSFVLEDKGDKFVLKNLMDKTAYSILGFLKDPSFLRVIFRRVTGLNKVPSEIDDWVEKEYRIINKMQG